MLLGEMWGRDVAGRDRGRDVAGRDRDVKGMKMLQATIAHNISTTSLS